MQANASNAKETVSIGTWPALKEQTDLTESHKMAIKYLTLYGHFTIAYSIVADHDINYFHIPKMGVIGFIDYNQFRIMLGDPLASDDWYEELIHRFIENGISEKKKISGIQCGYRTAKAFHMMGYRAQHMGVETIINIEKFDLKGKAKTKVRRWINTAANAGVKVVELEHTDHGLLKELTSISDEWLKSKINKHELNLLTRKINFSGESDTRTFYAMIEDRIIAFITFDPMYEDGRIIGFYADLCRERTSTPNGTSDIIIDFARKKFKQEGYKYISLGLSPLAEINNIHGFDIPLIRMILKINYNYGNRYYAFKGVSFHKSAYHDGTQSIKRPVYYLTISALPIIEIIKVFNLIGIIPKNHLLTSILYIATCILKDIYGQSIAYIYRTIKRSSKRYLSKQRRKRKLQTKLPPKK